MEATEDLLAKEEADQIRRQFRSLSLRPGCQVMWSGVPREWAQLWADKNNMQTLTTAMGPLMNIKHPSCLKSRKSAKAWKRYVQGASSLFADCLPKGDVVTVLSRPPPQRLNPKGISTYQIIEEPILKGVHGGVPVSRIDMVHMGVEGAENYRYQVWPKDQQNLWVEKFGLNRPRKHFKLDKKVYVYERNYLELRYPNSKRSRDVSLKTVEVEVEVGIHLSGAENQTQTSAKLLKTSLSSGKPLSNLQEKRPGPAGKEKVIGKGQGRKKKRKEKKEKRRQKNKEKRKVND